MMRPNGPRGPLEEVLDSLPAGELVTDAEMLREFARQMLHRAPEAYLTERSPASIARDVEDLFRLVDATPPGEVMARVRLRERGARQACLMTAMPDCPFIVETLREHLHGDGFGVDVLLHPVLVLDRDGQGRIEKVQARGSEGPRTSATFCLLEGSVNAEIANALEEEVGQRLEKVRLATRDFGAMLERAREVSADLHAASVRLAWRADELAEIRELLDWLRDGNFVFLGFRSYAVSQDPSGARRIQVDRGSGLGILSEESRSRVFEPTPVAELPPDLQARLLGGPPLIISKTNALSPVHRRARMDDVTIKRLGPEGEVLGERRFVGLFTSKAFSQDASSIPILRRKLRELLEAQQVERGSHDHGLVVRLFNSLPKEELFLTSVAELTPMAEALLQSHAGDDVLLFARPDSLRRGVMATVVLPKRRFSGEIRRQVQDLLAGAYGGRTLSYHLSLGESEQARLHFHIAADSRAVGSVDVEELRQQIRELVRSWDDRLFVALKATCGAEEAHRLRDRYGHAFSREYMASTALDTVVRDIESLEVVRQHGLRRVTLVDLDPPEPHAYWLTAFDRKTRYALSDVLPVLENLGFRVIQAEVHEVNPAEEDTPYTVHGFLVELPAAWDVDRASAERRVEDTLAAVQNAWAENLVINCLVLSAGLTWRQVAVLKAYGAYAFRVGATASRLGIRRPVIEHPQLARLLFEIFSARFDPHREGDREAASLALMEEFHAALEGVRSIEDDRTLRRLLELIGATVRTNYFQDRFQRDPTVPVALKIEPWRLDFAPRPRPKHEIWVSGAKTEGAHLRMGSVARGGLRWSDRTEDFRLEVLGLVKTQRVKNAVIVPAGAKGGFVVTRPPGEAGEGWREVGVQSYREFVSGLLDLTDNVVGGRVVHPANTVVRDGEDPYLVVAADKGTAALSDTANALASDYQFWLGDAFASGGSRGYDHKRMGITARGAWECVKRHFRELGIDIQSESFTVAGIGDMSGDVFGNGMLLSKEIRLVAAFDHRHIFLDPDPNPGRSWTERKRLFALPHSSWADYDAEVISRGGGVFGRGDKRIELSDEVRERLGIEERTANGESLIRAILRAPVDLLWNGGIGTYVKAGEETHGDVGDPGNDAVRVDAREVRARVVGEGGNLGFTQLARVEYAMRGGHINTDALDNSAGVDTSDHEVNLKILLQGMIDRGQMTLEGRDGLLRSVEENISAAVIANTYSQSQAVTLEEHRVRRRPETFRDALSALEREGVLDRGLEQLPSTEGMSERQAGGSPVLARPELAVLLAHAKLYLKRWLIESDLLDDPALLELFEGYFPRSLVEHVEAEVLREHRLRPNIIATVLTNVLVDRMGGAGLLELARDSHRSVSDVAKAWYVAFRAAAADEVLDGLSRLDNQIPAGVQAQWMLAGTAALAQAARWLLANADLRQPIGDLLREFGEPLRILMDTLTGLLPPAYQAVVADRKAICLADGLGEPLASRLVALEHMDALLPVAALSRETATEVARVGEIYFGLAADIDFPWLESRLAQLPERDLWASRASAALMLELRSARTRITRRILETVGAGDGVVPSIEAFRYRCAESIARLKGLMDELRAMDRPGLPALAVAVQAISSQCAEWSASDGNEESG